jgi:hypothetical protein
LIDSFSTGFHISRCSVGNREAAGGSHAGLNYGLSITNSATPGARPNDLFFDNLVSRGTDGDVCRIDAVSRAHFNNCSFSGSRHSHGFHLRGTAPGGCEGVSVHNSFVAGNALSGVNILRGASNTKIVACAIQGNGIAAKGHAGIAVRGETTGFSIIGNTCGGPGINGVSIGEACDWFIVTGNDIRGVCNGIANASTAAFHSVVANNLGPVIV